MDTKGIRRGGGGTGRFGLAYIHYWYTWRRSEVKVAQLCPTLCNPIDYTVHGILQARLLEWVAFPFSGGSFQPRDQTEVSRIAGGFFTSWATREAKNTGVGSLSLLQWIFLTQESNQSLLHCRWILYQLSYQGSKTLPNVEEENFWSPEGLKTSFSLSILMTPTIHSNLLA